MGGLAACAHVSLALAEPPLGFPTYRLEGLGHLCQTPGEVPPDCRWLPVSPGPFEEGTARVGGAGWGDGALGAMGSRGIG